MGRGWAVILAATLLAGGLGYAWWTRKARTVQALYLEPESPESWPGLGPAERDGLLAMAQDAAELDPRITVLLEAPPAGTGRPFEVLKLRAGRQGDALSLSFRDFQGHLTHAEGVPLEVLQRLFQGRGLRVEALPRLFPRDPAAFWELAALSSPFTFPELASRRNRAQALARAHPDSAAAWYRSAYLKLRLLIVEASEQADAHLACDEDFRRALETLPDFPRALHQYSRYKSDIGAAREALDLALRFRDRFPRHPLAYGALAYAARNAGLLEGARKALEARQTLVGGLLADPGLGENTYLYLGDLDAFERSLDAGPGATFNPLRVFYRGYARLLRGDRAGALALFREAQRQPGRTIQFEGLARIYELALSGREAEAGQGLQKLQDERTRIRIPDGEFTFKLAEAFAFLGNYGEAINTASLAFAQGFSCTRWYRTAPFLGPLQELPRWHSLLRHVQDREDLLARSYPPGRFGRG